MIRAVIADDSAFLRQVLQDVLTESGRIQVVGVAKNGKEAVALVKEHTPDVLILDVEMPVMNGLEALRIVMAESPLPVFMFSSLTQEGASVTIKALEYGAVDFLPKPMGGAHSLDTVAEDLIGKIAAVATRRRPPGISRAGGARPMPSRSVLAPDAPARPAGTPHAISKRAVDIIAMGSSTGGVQAAMKVIPKMPAGSKPIVWVQHMPQHFTKSFADRLNGLSQMTVKEAENGERIENGVCYLAEGGKQMRLQKRGATLHIASGGTDKVSGHCPSCNVLFDSVAEYFRANVIGVILTGMGDDGTRGLDKMRSQGAYVIGQNEASCVVYGMPRAAYQAGAVDIELDIDAIADGIVKAGGA
jgi:two-component system, chemotaxis family, protein-glutamate methylesterase/glutaminase